MEELTIYAYQAKEIEDTLRIVANIMNSRSKETCVDRKVMKSIEFITECLGKQKQKQ